MNFFEKQSGDFWRDITSFGSTLLYFIITLPFFVFETETAIQLTAGYVLIYLVAGTIKLIYFKNRPRKENYNNFVEKIDASAFPSIHSARTILMALIFSKFFDNTALTGFFVTIALLVAYSRIAIKKHYWSDVIGGVILGIITFFSVNMLS